MMDVKERIHEAVRAIAARCDGAVDEDGVGFSGVHAKFGHMVASLPTSALDDDVVATCHDMLRTYRGQLADYGIDYDALPTPEGGRVTRTSASIVRAVVAGRHEARIVFGFDPDLNDEVRTLPGAHFDRTSKTWVAERSVELYQFAARWRFTIVEDLSPEPPKIESLPQAPGTVRLVNGRIVVQFTGYRPDLNAAIKAVPGRQWDRGSTSWLVPTTSIRAVKRMADKFGLDVDPSIEQAVDGPAVRVTVRPDALMVSGPFHPVLRDWYGSVGARYTPRQQVWVVPIDCAAQLVVVLDRIGFDHDLELDEVDAVRAMSDAVLEASRALDAELDPIPGFAMELFPFQRAGVAYLAKHRRAFLADHVGLGKTAQTLAALQLTESFPAVILCPASLKLNWRREAERALPGREVRVLSGTKPRPFGLWRPDIVVANYDIATSWAEALAGLEPRALICDESHLLKEQKTQRSQAAVTVGRAVAQDGMVLCLSATPVLNNRREYANQLDVLGRLEEFGGPAAVEATYDINDRLRRTGAFIRRTKKDVLPDLPPVIWSHVPVEGDPKIMAEYERAEAELLEYIAEKAAEAARAEGGDPRLAARTAKFRAASAEHLVRINTLKRIAARAKLKATHGWVADFLAGGDDKMLLFAHHLDVLDSVESQFGCDSIRGGQSADERMAVVDRFQGGEGRLVALALTAGGVGLTLTAASTAVFVEQGWTPGIHDQAIGRMYGRLNDIHGASGVILVIEGTIDVWIAELIANKRLEVDHATDGIDPDDNPEGGQSILGDLLDRLVDKALSQRR